MVGKWRGNVYVVFKVDEVKMKDGGYIVKDVYIVLYLIKQEKELRIKFQISYEFINVIVFF